MGKLNSWILYEHFQIRRICFDWHEMCPQLRASDYLRKGLLPRSHNAKPASVDLPSSQAPLVPWVP